MLYEDQGQVIFDVVEAAAPGKKLVMRGKFGECDKPTANGRVYGKKLMEREVARLQKPLSERRVTGALDHPADGKLALSNTSHLMTKLWIDDDGIVMGEAEVLNTDAGRNLRALVEGRVAVGVSSRGNGTTTPRKDEAGKEDVNDDYQLATYDVVADPAVRDALPSVTLEHVEGPALTLAERVAAEWPEAVAELTEAARRDAGAQAAADAAAAVSAAVAAAEGRIRAELQEGVERRLAAALVEARGSIHAAVVEEIQADPATADARAILAGVADLVGAYRQAPDEAAVREALAAAEARLVEAVAAREAAQVSAQEATVRAHVWDRLLGHAHGPVLAELLREVPLGATCEAADRKVDDLLRRLPAIVEERQRGVDALVQDLAAAHERIAALTEECATLREQGAQWTEKGAALESRLQRAVALGQRAVAEHADAEAQVQALQEAVDAAQATAAQADQRRVLAEAKLGKVAGLANGRQVLSLLEGAETPEAVDAVVRAHGKGFPTGAALDAVRAAVQRGQAADPHPLHEGRLARGSSVVDGNGEVLDGDELAQMAGLTVTHN
jgi:hypothetical protein